MSGHIGGSHLGYVIGTLNRTDNTAADVIPAPGVGKRIVVTRIVVTNMHATVSTKVSIRDGTTVKQTNGAVANGGGWAEGDGFSPVFIGSDNTAITAICGTTGADVDITIKGYVQGTP